MRIEVWCDHGARKPWVASHVDGHGWVVDVLGRWGSLEAALEALETWPEARDQAGAW